MKRTAGRLSLWIFAIMMVFFMAIFCLSVKADDYPSAQSGSEVYPSMQGGSEVYPSAQGTAEVWPSMQQGIDITGASITPVGQSITNLEASMVTGVSSANLMFIQEWDVTAYDYPLTVTFRVAGTENLTIYVLSDNENGWSKVDYGAGPTLFVTFTHDTHAAVYVSESIPERTPVENIQIDPIRVYEGVLSQFNRYTPFTVTFKDGTIQVCNRGAVNYDGIINDLSFEPNVSSVEWEAEGTYSTRASVLDYSMDVPIEVYRLNSIEIEEDNGLTLFLHQSDGETVAAEVYYFDHFWSEVSDNTEGFLVTDHGAFQANIINYDSCQNVKVSIGGLESNVISSSKWFELNRFAFRTWIISGNYEGTVNQDNIDMLLYDTVRFFSSDELPVLEPPLVYDADFLKAKMHDLFVITADFDMSLSSYYNAERKTIELMPGGVGGRQPGFRIIISDTEQGFLREAADPKYDSLFLLDDNFRIKRMGKTSSGDVYPSAQGTAEVYPSAQQGIDISGATFAVNPVVKTIDDTTASSVSGMSVNDLMFIQEWDIKSDTYPLTVTFNVSGAQDMTLYVFSDDENDWTTVNKKAGGYLAVTFTHDTHAAVYVGPSLLEYVYVDDFSISEGAYCMSTMDQGGTDRYIKYQFESIVNIVMKYDGKEYSGTPYEIQRIMENLTGSAIRPEITSEEQSFNKQWRAGNKYQATVSLMGKEDTFYVDITDSPFASMQVEDGVVIKDVDGYTSYDAAADANYFRYDYSPSITLTTKNGEEVHYEPSPYSATLVYENEVFPMISTDDQDDNHWDLGDHQVTFYCGGLTTTAEITVIESPVASLAVDPIRVYEGAGLTADASLRMPFTVTFKDGTTQRCERRVVHYNGKTYYLNYSYPGSSLDWVAGETYTMQASILGFNTDATIEVCGIESLEIVEDEALTLFIHQTDGEIVEANVQNFYVMAASGGTTAYGSLRTDKGVFNASIINYRTCQDVQISIGEITSNVLPFSKWMETNSHAMEVWYLGWHLDTARSTRFNGIVNKNNIDKLMSMSHMYHSHGSPTSAPESVYPNTMKERMRNLFAITGDFDITLSSRYNAQTGMIDMPARGGVSYNFDCCIISTDTEQGFIDYSKDGPEKDLTVLFDEDYKIKQFGTPSTPTSATITWKNEDGTILEVDEDVPFGETPSYDGAAPTKPSDAQYTYTFAGWDPEITVVAEDVTYTAIYTKTSQGGMDDYPSIKVGDTKKIEPVAGGMAYYQFTPEESGWYALDSFDEELGVSYAYISIYEEGEYRQVRSWGYWESEHLHMQHRFNAGETYRIELEADGMTGTYNVRLYGPETCTISFHSGEGDFIDWSTELTTDTYEDEFPLGATIDVFPDVLSPESGKILAGWALNSDAEIPDIQHWNYQVAGNADLYAVYGEPITVVYDCNGGYSNYYGEPSDHFEINTGAGDWFSDNMAYYPGNAKDFLGWYSEPEGGKKYSNDDHMMEDTTVYAHWEEPVTVTFDANGGYFTGMITGESYTWQFKKGEQVYFGTGIAVHPDPDMQFAGWYTEKEGGICVSQGEYSEYIASEDVTFYAHWTKSVTVSFDANGGYFYGDPEWTVINNSYSEGAVVYPPTVQNPDATLVLDGWYDDRTGGSKVDLDQAIMDSITLYAHWIQGTTVTFDANGGVFQYSGEPTRTDAFLPGHDLKVSSYIYKSELSHSNPRKVLVGWAATKDASKEDVITGSVNVDDVTTLYAVWEDGIKITEVAGDGYFYGNYNYETGEYEKNPSLEFYVPSGSKVGALSSIYSGMEGTNYYIQAYTDQSHKKDFGERSLTENGPIVASDYVLTEDTVLYVVWTDIAIVTFDAGDGYFVGVASANPPTIKTSERPVGQELPINYRDSFETRSNDPTLAHIGWSETGKEEDIITMITATEDMTLHAVYKTGPVVILEPIVDIPYFCWLNGQLLGTDANKNQAVWPEEIPLSDLAIRAGGSGREYSDYRFFGISTTKDGLNLIDDDWYPTEDMTLYLVLKDAFSVNFQAYPGYFQSTGYLSNNVLVPKGNVIGKVETPVYPEHIFVGWQNNKTKETIDPETYVPTEHTQIDALWEDDIEQSYIITFVDEDGTVLKEATEYPEGTAAADIVKPTDPIKPADAQYTYAFAGWDPEITEVTADATYTATYSKTVNKYTVTFVDEDGTVLKNSTEYPYGTEAPDIMLPATPTKAATAQYTYMFVGWTPGIVDVTENAIYKATYSETVNKYSVTFVDADGTILMEAAEYLYGTPAADIVKPDDPNKATDAQYTYTFAGWIPEVSEVSANVTYKAKYTATVNKYTITWKNEDGTLLKTEEVAYGSKPEYTGQQPTKVGTDVIEYVFDKWNPAVVPVNGDAVYTASFVERQISFPGVASNHTGLAQSAKGDWYYLKNGKIDFSCNGIVSNAGNWWKVENGKVNFEFEGIANNENGWWYLSGGKVDFSYTGFAENEYGWWYVESGQITFKKTDVINGNGKEGWWLVENSKVSDKTTVAQNAYGWWKVTDGKVDFDFTGLADNDYGWWYLSGGKVDFSYTGFAENEYGWWYVESGQITFKKTDVINGNGKEGWWLVENSKVSDRTTVAQNAYGWWKVTDGKVDFDFTGLADNDYGWWYLSGGKVDFNYTGFADNEYGWWYVESGQITFKKNDIVSGIVDGENGWWLVAKSKVTPGPTVAQNAYGWWYIDGNGQVDFEYNNIGYNEYGGWYIKNGQVDFKFTGSAYGHNFKDGKAVD